MVGEGKQGRCKGGILMLREFIMLSSKHVPDENYGLLQISDKDTNQCFGLFKWVACFTL